MGSRLSFYLHRLRYDSWLMLLLDLTKPFGVAVCPFWLYLERLDFRAGRPKAVPEGITIRPLVPDDIEVLCRFPDRRTSAEHFHQRLERGDLSLGAWAGEELVGFTWASFVLPTGALERGALGPHQSYLHDAYTAPAWRGKSIAPCLRSRLYAALAEQGRTELYSFTLVGNVAARKFKEKLGAERVHTGLYLRFFRWHVTLPSRVSYFSSNSTG
jgi:GNAT superfamily N-acetyltransferase